MSLESVKNSFIKHLTDKFEKNIFGKFNPEDMSLFEYFTQFNAFLSQETAGMDVSLFSFSTADIQEIVHNISLFTEEGADAVNDKVATGYFEGEKQELGMYELYAEIFKDENVIGMFDTDGDSKLSEDEMAAALQNIAAIDGVDGEVSLKDFQGLQAYIQEFKEAHPDLSGEELSKALLESINGLDGDLSSLSVDDFQKLGEQLDEMGLLGVNPETVIPEEFQDIAQAIQSVPDVYSSNKFQGNPLNTHASNYQGPSGELKSHEMRDGVINTDTEIANLENQIVEQNNLKLEAEGASKAYFEENQYDEKVSSLNAVIGDINTYNSTLTTAKSDLHETQYDLNAAKVELQNLADPVIFTEYADEIKQLREKLQNDITTLTQKEQELQTTISNTETKLSQAETQRDELQTQIQTIEDNNPDAESKAKIAEYNSNIQQLQNEINAKKATKQSQENELDTQRKQEIEDSNVYGLAQAYRQSEFVKFMMDYATDPATKKKYDEWHAKNSGAYCAVFTSEVSEIMFAAVLDRLGVDPKTFQTYGDQNSSTQGLQGNQMSMSVAPWGDKLEPARKALGLLTNATVHLDGMSEKERAELVRQGKIYPGMTFEYNGSYHTGFIESINKDLSWNTIEGNTAVTYADGTHENGTVGSHKRDATNMRMYSATDSTYKAIIWAYQAGKITKEQMIAMTYAYQYQTVA